MGKQDIKMTGTIEFEILDSKGLPNCAEADYSDEKRKQAEDDRKKGFSIDNVELTIKKK